MDAAERKRLIDQIRKGGVVLLGKRFITSESQLPSFVNPPKFGDPIFDDLEDPHEEDHPPAARADSPRAEGDSA